MATESVQRLASNTEDAKSKRKRSKVFVSKFIFVASVTVLAFVAFAAVFFPALLFLTFSIIFAILMVFRLISYTKSHNALFIAGICYFVNVISIVFIWGFPSSLLLFYVQFGLANGTVYCGIFVYKNAFAFHHLDKMTTCFIHILPPLFSYCVRWFPEASSNFWWSYFIETNGLKDVTAFNPVTNWIFLFAVPNAIFFVHAVLYHVIVHVIVKPDEKYNDSYRYLLKKFTPARIVCSRIPKSLHLVLWVAFNVAMNLLVTLLSVAAWCSFFVHSVMMVAIVVTMAWYGACYYIDYFAYLALRKALATGEVVVATRCGGNAAGALVGVGSNNLMAPEEMETTEDEDTGDEDSKIDFDYQHESDEVEGSDENV